MCQQQRLLRICPETRLVAPLERRMLFCRQMRMASRPVDLWMWSCHRCLVGLALQPTSVNNQDSEHFSSHHVLRQRCSNLFLSIVRYNNQILIYIYLLLRVSNYHHELCHLRSGELIKCARRCKWGDFDNIWHILKFK